MNEKWKIFYRDEDNDPCFSPLWATLWMIVLCMMIPLLGGLGGIGNTQMTGYVVRQYQAEVPWKTTTVTYTLVHPTSVVEVDYYTQTYDGWYDFTLGHQYKITAHRDVFQIYPEIVEMRIID